VSLKEALKDWESQANSQAKEEKGDEAEVVKVEESTEIKCHFSRSRGAITKVDKSLEGLSQCDVLSLSTNSIDKVPSLKGMSALRVLSIGRNNIKKLSGLSEVAGTLEELWMSYNSVKLLDGLENLTKLKILYCGNNKIEKISELEKIVSTVGGCLEKWRSTVLETSLNS
jgi:dynein light chain 1